jgi:DNA-binding MarR family transcriptional regulator
LRDRPVVGPPPLVTYASVGADEDLDVVTDAVLTASRAFVAIAAQSVAGCLPELTLPQYRVLAVLATRGPQNLGSLADTLEVNPSTASRLCDRLVRKRLITRETGRDDRREVLLSPTPDGMDLYRQVIDRRRAKLAHIVEQLAPETRSQLVAGLRAISKAVGEAPDQPWSLGWTDRVGAE